MTILRVSLLFCAVATTGVLLANACGSSGGSGSTGNPQALCMQGCEKATTLCFADAGALGQTATATCKAACTSQVPSSNSSCPNSSAVLAAYQACINANDSTCDQFTSCVEGVPACTGGGSGGRSGSGTGGANGGGTGGANGGGTGGFQFDGSIPGLDADFSGTCADLLACCNSMTDAQARATCMQQYTQIMALGDGFCGIALGAIRSGGMCQ